MATPAPPRPLPTPRQFLTSLINSLPPPPPPSTSNRLPASNPLSTLPPSAHAVLTTLHAVLPPPTLLQALDVLDRHLVTRIIPKPAIDVPPSAEDSRAAIPGIPADLPPLGTSTQGHQPSPNPRCHQARTARDTTAAASGTEAGPVPTGGGSRSGGPGRASFYLVRSAQAARGRASRPGGVGGPDGATTGGVGGGGGGRTYIVRLQAWNCSCAAFAFAAFPVSASASSSSTAAAALFAGLSSRGGAGVAGDDDAAVEGRVRARSQPPQHDEWGVTDLHVGAARDDGAPDWEFGGLSLDGRKGGWGAARDALPPPPPPCCKHLLACLLAERWEAVLGGYVGERVVGREELAGLAADG
ncbi:MAG: hypothetical protein M1818_003964 [Claussenomyces sp. TS43310]|nr:MAG: hypothetical protein M1818_003964 [Claussenomyces sp. TS43310]